MDLSGITSSGDISQIFPLLLAAAVVWLVLRFILKLTIKVFMTGCSIIVLLALAMILLNTFSGS